MCYRIKFQLFLAALTLSAASVGSAAPVAVGLDFVGPGANSLNLDATAAGTVTTGINGKLFVKFTGDPDPQTDPIGLNPDTISVMSMPIALATNMTGGPAAASVSIESSSWTPLSISGVNLDFLNGVTPAFAIDQIVLETNAPIIEDTIDDNTIRIDLGGTFVSVKFFQNPGSVTLGPGNTYAIPGTLVGVVDLMVEFDAFGGILALGTALGTTDFETPFTLEGTLGVDSLSTADANLTFDGLTSGSFLLTGISTTITLNSFGAQANLSLDVNGGIDLNFNYHLEDTAHVPEPGAFILFGIGAIGLLPYARRRLKKSRVGGAAKR